MNQAKMEGRVAHAVDLQSAPDNFYEKIKPRLRQRIGRKLHAARRVLDLGCGNCDLDRYLASTYRQEVTGVISGTGASWDAYPMFKDSREVNVRLLFDRKDMVVVGGQVAGVQGVAERLDLIALAIHHRLKATDLAEFNHCAHPLQSGVPSQNPIVMAAEDAMRKMSVPKDY